LYFEKCICSRPASDEVGTTSFNISIVYDAIDTLVIFAFLILSMTAFALLLKCFDTRASVCVMRRVIQRKEKLRSRFDSKAESRRNSKHEQSFW
jgi:hypothetical protein